MTDALLESLHDRDRIESILRSDPYLHLYEIGDLDPFFWPRTVWYGLREGDECRAVACLYLGATGPTLLALGGDATRALLDRLAPVLPGRFYRHQGPGRADVLARSMPVEMQGRHDKMGLLEPERAAAVDAASAEPLGPGDAAELGRFYEASYPGNWFDPRMLETRAYVGVRDRGELAGAGGVHVLSEERRVAAIGNVATRPDRRGRGVSRVVVAGVLGRLAGRVDLVGLNVDAANRAAIRCYEGLGFRKVAEYDEAWCGRR